MYTSRRVPESVLFTPKHSLTAKNTLHHKSRLEHAKVIHRQALLTHTPHVRCYLCFRSAGMYTLCIVSLH